MLYVKSKEQRRQTSSLCCYHRSCCFVPLLFVVVNIILGYIPLNEAFWTSSLSSVGSTRQQRIIRNNNHVAHHFLQQQQNENDNIDIEVILEESLESKTVRTTPLQALHHRDNERISMDRRRALLSVSMATAGAMLTLPKLVSAEDDISSPKSLEDIALGEGQWKGKTEGVEGLSSSSPAIIPAPFTTYATRFLLKYDEGVSSWWKNLNQSWSLLPADEIQKKQNRAFGDLARSVQLAMDQFVKKQQAEQMVDFKNNYNFGYERLLKQYMDKYGNSNFKTNDSNTEEAQLQIGLLFSMLPMKYQPTSLMLQYFGGRPTTVTEDGKKQTTENSVLVVDSTPSSLFTTNPTALLPTEEFQTLYIEEGTQTQAPNYYYRIEPYIKLYEIGVDEEFGQTATVTPFGPLAVGSNSLGLIRELPSYSPNIYALFGISGATGCALTHTVVIPLDVVKTRTQTDGESENLIQGANRILKNEGLEALLLGSQATIVGYFWYGLSVYPSYTFFKRYITQVVLTPEVAAIHMNDIALIAGAIAAVIASLGLTPLEAARIRAVAEPEIYKPLGLIGTMNKIANEGTGSGLTTLYAGLPSLLARQVIFGSVKFLAFERACDTIFTILPLLKDATWTSLCVSLVAGGFSGALSSIISQPADSVLTYVAQQNRGGGDGDGDNSNRNLGLIEGCTVMVQEEGPQSLFRGLGSRCVWAGSIIAGQFLLYDVFRTFFHVNSDDLSQLYQLTIQ